MGQSRFSGAWARKASTTAPIVPLEAERDPEHLNPTSNVDVVVGVPLWVSTAPAPDLPVELTVDAYGTPISTGGGPIDRTPEDPNYGPGAGNGQTVAQAQAVRTEWMSRDDGAVAARQWQATTDRDGSPKLDLIQDADYAGDSPSTVMLQRSGIGVPENDPYARTGRRLWRWWDRVIDMHRWDVSFRPKYLKTASTAQQQPPGGQTQYDSPWVTPSAARVSPDAFVAPQMRRTPAPDWATPIATDGAANNVVGNVNDFGLTSWGL